MKKLRIKTHDFRCHLKTAGKKSLGEKCSVQTAPSQNCSWKTCGWKIFSSEGAIPKLQVKNPEIKYHPKTADENSCVSKVPSQNWRPNTEPPNATGCLPLFQKVQNPDSNKLHNASKSCQATNIYKKSRGAKFSKNAQMINVVLLLVFQCLNAQFWHMNTAYYSTDELLYQNRCQKITSTLNTDNLQLHWLPTTSFQTVQNLDLRKLYNASKSCSRQKNLQKAWSRNWIIPRWVRKLTKMNCMDGSMIDEL